MKIPNALTLAEIQSAFRDIEESLYGLETGVIPLHGGRVTGAGKPLDAFDYIRKFDLDTESSDLRDEIDALKVKLAQLQREIIAAGAATVTVPIGTISVDDAAIYHQTVDGEGIPAVMVLAGAVPESDQGMYAYADTDEDMYSTGDLSNYRFP